MKYMKIEYILLVCIAVLILCGISKYTSKEGMTNQEHLPNLKYFREKYTELRDDDIYDAFYASIYEQIFADLARIQFEVDKTISYTNMNRNSRVLDIAPGPGYHLKAFHQHAGYVEGIDKSLPMVKYARKKYEHIKFTHGDAIDAMSYAPDSFSHITAYYFTMYYFKDKHRFLTNVYKWLKKNGYFVVHLVNRKMFDTIVPPANPLLFVSPQKYAKERITHSEVKFNNFDYSFDFKLDDVMDQAIVEETFKHKSNGHIRKHIQTFHAPKLTLIVEMAKNVGFRIVKRFDMVDCEHEYQYMYIMQK